MEEREPTPIAVPDALRGLDPAAIAALRDVRVELERLSGLDERTIELVRLGALVALARHPRSLDAHVERAQRGRRRTRTSGAPCSRSTTLVGVPRLIAAVPAVRDALET